MVHIVICLLGSVWRFAAGCRHAPDRISMLYDTMTGGGLYSSFAAVRPGSTFMAERVLYGHVISSGITVLGACRYVGIGSTLFSQFT